MTPPGIPPHESNSADGANLSPQDRLLDLLTDHALGELTPAEVQEMNTLLADHPELQDHGLEEAAALLAVSELPELDVPAGLQQKLTADAQAFFADGSQSSAEAVDPSTPVFPAPAVPDKRPATQVVLAFIGGGVVGGLAAAVLLALLLSDPIAAPEPNPFPGALALTPAERVAQWQDQTLDQAQHPWAANAPGYEAVTGEVLWSNQTQTGFMVLANLPVNDPTRDQYQLWIVDPSRDEFPVDGGVFNVAEFVAEDGKAYVPINAKLPVDQPAAFAITLEKPGGVVKSNNQLLVVAPATS
ncbi:MAG: anti-sigma factor [Planctomycetota bacterium]